MLTGQVKLAKIGFTVPAGLMGLERLQTAPTTILSVDVIGGTKDAVVLDIKGESCLSAVVVPMSNSIRVILLG